jgi:GNAT superfamily N-acetyltransferase
MNACPVDMPIQETSSSVTLRSVTVRHLEMKSPAELRAKRTQRGDVTFSRVDPPWPELNRFFYVGVGGDHYWVDRLAWTREQWFAHLSRPELETWVLSAAGLPAGYAEMERRRAGDVEISYFGLLARHAGQGLGAHMLTCTVERAWAMGANRVWLHTCSLDHPAALPNYLARGFREFRVETIQKLLPARAVGSWPWVSGP